MNEVVKSDLDRIDWNFPGAKPSPKSPHSLFRFPGNFIADIPSCLLEILTAPGEVILDPFCGSGTTLVESAIRGRQSIGVDSNLIATLLTESKLTLISAPAIGGEIHTFLEAIEVELTIPLHAPEVVNAELSAWYHPDTLTRLFQLWNLVNRPWKVGNVLFKTLFFEVLFDCAAPAESTTKSGKRRRHHWGWVADNVKPRFLATYNPSAMFRDKLISADAVHRSMRSLEVPLSKVVAADSRFLPLEESSVDHVITSPPYLGMIDYTLANRLAYIWIDQCMGDNISKEIGSRRNRNRSNAESKYLEDLEKCTLEIFRVLKPGGYCAIVLGSSRKFPAAASSAVNLWSKSMRLVWGPRSRFPTRRRVSDRQGSSPHEMVAVFQK